MASSPSSTPAPIPRRRRGQGRTTVVPVRLTPADRDSLQAYAERHGSSLSTVLSALGRQLAQGGGDQVQVLAEPSPVLREIAVSLARCAGALNQVARLANQGRVHVSRTDLEAIDDAYALASMVRDEVRRWV